MTPVIVLAGGKGTRLRAAVPNLPKCLAPVASSSFLNLLLDRLISDGVKHIIASLGYKADLVVPVLREYSDQVKINWHVESTPLGTGGAIYACMKKFLLSEAIVVNADTWLSGDLSPLLSQRVGTQSALISMGVCFTADRSRYGSVEISGGKVIEYGEKGIKGDGLINAGIYRVKANCFDSIRDQSQFSFEESIIPNLISECEVDAIELDVDFIDIGIPDDYFKFVSLYEG